MKPRAGRKFHLLGRKGLLPLKVARTFQLPVGRKFQLPGRKDLLTTQGRKDLLTAQGRTDLPASW